jgi:hypothetical protein
MLLSAAFEFRGLKRAATVRRIMGKITPATPSLEQPNNSALLGSGPRENVWSLVLPKKAFLASGVWR